MHLFRSSVFYLQPYLNNAIACTLNYFVKTKNIVCRAFVLFKRPAKTKFCVLALHWIQ